MNFGSLLISPSAISIMAAAGLLAGLIVWWLIRKKQTRIWLPTLRVLTLESRKLPKMILEVPPLIAFLCFLAAASAFTFFALSPTKQIFTAFEKNEARYHLFLDLSPSMQADVNFNDYKANVLSFWESLNKSGRVSLSSSASLEIVRPESLKTLNEYLGRLSFHRAGVRLGGAVKQQLPKYGVIDRLFVFSDGDLHSWSDFNWRILAEDTDVVWVDSSKLKQKSTDNYFIDKADYLANPQANDMDWDVTISRRGGRGQGDGVLKAYLGDTELGRTSWKFAENSTQMTARISWPARNISWHGQEEALLFKIEPAQADVVSMDNEFRTMMRGIKQNSLIIAEPIGELMLEDPTNHLQNSLEVLGFNIKRMDSIIQPGPSPKDYPFWIVTAGISQGIDRYCPKSIESMRLEKQTSQGAKSFLNRDVPLVWFAPENLDVDYRSMCWCYSRLMISTRALTTSPDYCQDVHSRDTFIGLLTSLGAKQIGGATENIRGAIAFHSKDEKSGLEMLTFTVPLNPSLATGISHAGLPLLVNSLLSWQGLIGNQGKQVVADWPRLVDISANEWGEATPNFDSTLKAISNVPLGESLLARLDAKQMPSRWLAGSDPSTAAIPNKKDQDDPLPWIRICAIVMIAALLLEGLWLVVLRVRALTRATALIFLMCLIGGFGFSNRSHAEIPVNLLQYEIPFDAEFSGLSREVSRRTSIDLAKKPVEFLTFDAAAQRQGWLWVKNLRAISNSKGELLPEVAAWIKRGGFLVIENISQLTTLNQLTVTSFVQESVDVSEWKPIPPDHELMRSFHLLDSLPDCQKEVWQGFHFDRRLAILAVPFPFLETLLDQPKKISCRQEINSERSIRVFINLLMVVLATDYKKDQIHLPEILKRLR